MKTSDRGPRLGSESSAKLGCDTNFSIARLTLRSAAASRLLRWSLGCAVFSALAACQQSSSGQTTLTSSASGSTAKPALTLAANNDSVATDTQTTSPFPTATLSASPTTIANGGMSTLSWNSQNATACTASGGWHGAVATSGTWSTGALSNPTEYELICTGAGGSATQSATVTVSELAPVVALTASPSTVDVGTGSTLSWSSQNATSCSTSGGWSGKKSLSGSQSTGGLTTNTTYSITCSGTGGTATQSTTLSVKPKAPSVSINASPSTVANGSSSKLRWSSSNATSCSASGAWSGGEPTSGSQSTGPVTANATYTLTCTGAGGGSASQSTTVSVKSPTPTVSLSVGPSAITSGGSATLTWSSANATSCSASGAWSGALPVSGSQSTGALKANATYSLTCTGAGGSATQATTVSVTSPAPAPTVSLAASPSSVVSGKSSTLSWSTTKATSCTASGGWSGSQPTSGSHSTGALSANTTYTLTCTGAGGSAAQSATVTVTTPVPRVTLSANPSTVASGAASTLTWSSTNATSCAASGGWSGSEAASGSQATTALTA